MKWVMDERLKHRLAGVAVIVSIAAIFAPAVMKKSNQRFEAATQTSFKLPPKPDLPKVLVKDEETLFKTVKVAHVEIKAVEDTLPPSSVIAKAEPVSQSLEAPVKAVHPVQEKRSSKITVAKANPPPSLPAVAKQAPTPTAFAGYSVQLATFTQKNNALALMNRLKSKGYKAYISQTTGPRGAVYKVFAGQLRKKPEAYQLQQQLAGTMQLKGFVVPANGLG